MDNKYIKEGCPAKMNNVRHFTSYVNIENVDHKNQHSMNKNEHEYRSFLQNQGIDSLCRQTKNIENKFSCFLK